MESFKLLLGDIENNSNSTTNANDAFFLGTAWDLTNPTEEREQTIDLPGTANDEWVQSLFDQLPMSAEVNSPWPSDVAAPTEAFSVFPAQTTIEMARPASPPNPLVSMTLPDSPESSGPETAAQTKPTQSTPIKMKKSRRRETVFVNETWQHVYEKSAVKSLDAGQEKASSPDSSSSMSPEDRRWNDVQLKQMTSKQRRQHRNKMSAKNFRERRKEYIEQLESKVDEQSNEMTRLRTEVSRLSQINDAQFKELEHWRRTGTVPYSTPRDDTSPSATSLSSCWPSSPSSDEHSSSELMPMLTDRAEGLFDFDLYDINTHISNALLPDWDYSTVSEKTPTVTTTTVALPLQTYPLLTAALMSIVVHHTLLLHFPDTIPHFPPMEKGIHIDLPNDPLPTRKLSLTRTKRSHRQSLLEGPPPYSKEKTQEEDFSTTFDAFDEDDEELSDESIKALLLGKYYMHYAFLRLKGNSLESIVTRTRACIRKRREKSQQHKCCKFNAIHQLRCVSAFVSVAAAAVRQPKQVHHIVQNHSMTQFRSLRMKKLVQ